MKMLLHALKTQGLAMNVSSSGPRRDDSNGFTVGGAMASKALWDLSVKRYVVGS